MSQAFKCDICGELFEGASRQDSISLKAKGVTFACIDFLPSDLCPKCREAVLAVNALADAIADHSRGIEDKRPELDIVDHPLGLHDFFVTSCGLTPGYWYRLQAFIRRGTVSPTSLELWCVGTQVAAPDELVTCNIMSTKVFHACR